MGQDYAKLREELRQTVNTILKNKSGIILLAVEEEDGKVNYKTFTYFEGQTTMSKVLGYIRALDEASARLWAGIEPPQQKESE